VKLPEPFAALVTAGELEGVLRPLGGGGGVPRVYLVRRAGALCVAKAERAPGEADGERRTLEGLRGAGVSVPAPLGVVGGVLLMELVRTLEGAPAPRLSEALLTGEEESATVYRAVVEVVKRMAAAGFVHPGLSARKVLLSAHGPVVVGLAGALRAEAASEGARGQLVRGLHAIRERCGAGAPVIRGDRHGEEIWEHLIQRTLTPETRLTGRLKAATRKPGSPPPPRSDARPWDRAEPAGRHPRPWAVKATTPSPEPAPLERVPSGPTAQSATPREHERPVKPDPSRRRSRHVP
jgi:hypothetical protein